MPGSLGELDHLGLPGQEIRFHGKAMVAMVAEASAMAEDRLPEPVPNLIDYPHYKQVFKSLKALVAETAEKHGVSQELLASRRQINQLLNWHWKLKPQAGKPELVDGWRGALLGEGIAALLAAE